MDHFSQTAHRKSRPAWLWTALAAVILFLGGLASDLIAADLTEPLRPYSAWIWGFFVVALFVTVAMAVRDVRARNQESTASALAQSEEVSDLQRRYLLRVSERMQFLPLRGVDLRTANAETREQDRMRMPDVYVALNTTSRSPVTEKREAVSEEAQSSWLIEGGEPISALEAVASNHRLVLLGAPGSGKSTFINHLAFCLAREQTHPKENWIAHLSDWPATAGALLPVPITLREVAAWFQTTQPPQRKSGLWAAYLEYWLNDLGLADYADLLATKMRQGRTLLLLDGLDEVPLQDDTLARIKEMIADLPVAYPETTIVVTCRVLSYQDARWQLDETVWRSVELAELSEDQIDDFIRAWYRHLAEMSVVSDAAAMSMRLSQAVRRPDLWRFAGNPLLLTVMALVHTHKGELPDARAVLYEDVVDLLLWRWDAIRLAQPDGRETTWRHLLQAAELSDVDIKRALWELAFDIHNQAGDGEEEATADITGSELLARLRVLHPQRSLDWSELLVKIIKERAGLLVEGQLDIYSFPHRTFQEFLAGSYLSNQPDFTERSLDLTRQGAFWREVILLAVGRLVHVSGDIDRPLMLINELCPAQLPALDDAPGWRNLWLAGSCLLELGVKRAERRSLGAVLIERVRSHLLTLITSDRLEPRERAEAGNVLSALGDPRDFEEMVPIPSGEFIMGGEEFDDEQPRHSLYLDSYRIGRYLVTNEQYARFVAATGHEPPLLWRGTTPPSELRTHPVVYVSWHDARAYCAWLSTVRGEEVRLPSEAEWEKAARGVDGREYPWGDEFDARFCNMDETGIGETSPVGIFVQGQSPYACFDMAGNVWEWTGSLWGKDWYNPQYRYPYNAGDGREDGDASDDVRRVLRGGSFNYLRQFVRCAYRNGFTPDVRFNLSGFRVLSPGL